MDSQEGRKFDTNKIQYDLIPAPALKGIATVLTIGAQKYAPNNWRWVYPISRYYDALMRHLEAIRMGEWLDPESGQPHIDHVLCNAIFLRELWSEERELKEKVKLEMPESTPLKKLSLEVH